MTRDAQHNADPNMSAHRIVAAGLIPSPLTITYPVNMIEEEEAKLGGRLTNLPASFSEKADTRVTHYHPRRKLVPPAPRC